MPPAVPYGGMQHVSRGPARRPQPGASGGTPAVAAKGVPPAGPPPTVPPTMLADAHPALRAPPAPMPQAEPVGARYTKAQRSQQTELTRERAAARLRALPARPVAPGKALPQPAAPVTPAKSTGAPPAPVAPGEPVMSGLALAYGARPAPAESRDAPPLRGPQAAVQAAPAAQGAGRGQPTGHQRAARAGPGDVPTGSCGWRRGPTYGDGDRVDVAELIAQALAASRPKGVVSTPDVAKGAEEAVEERVELRQPEEVGSGRTSTERSMAGMQEGAVDQGALAPCGGRTEVEGVEEWMWEWRESCKEVPREPCLAGLVCTMDLDAGTSHARLPDNLRARLDAAEAARGRGPDEQPLAPFPPRPESPPHEASGEEEERECSRRQWRTWRRGGRTGLASRRLPSCTRMTPGPTSTPAWTWTQQAPLVPMPTAVLPPPLGSSEPRYCRFHAAEGAHRHHLTGARRREVGLLEGTLKRYEFLSMGRIAREESLVAVPPEGGRVRCVQLGDAAVLDHHPREVRAAEPQENLPLSVRLSVGRLLDEAELEDVRHDGLYVALWRSGAHAWRRELVMRPLMPPALGSHALLVAMHPGGMEVVFGENGTDRLLLAVDSAVLVPTSSSYRLVSRADDPRLLLVVGTRRAAGTGHQGPERCAVSVGEDEAAGASASHEDEIEGGDTEGPAVEERQKEQGPDPGPS